MNKYLEKIASTEDLVNAGFGAGLGYGSEVLALKNPNSKFLKSLTFGHKGMGAAVGAASNVIAGRVVKGFMNKQASDTEYRGLSGWQTAGLTAAGLVGVATAMPHIRRLDDVVRKADKGGHANWSKVKHLRAALGRRTNAAAAALYGSMAVPGAVALHRQYQDFQSGNPDSHYLRSALLGGVAGGLAPTKHLTVGRGALAGLGASAANQIYQHYKG